MVEDGAAFVEGSAEVPASSSFGVRETHGILWREENRVLAKSDGMGWRSIYASVQREAPYEASYQGVSDHLVILHLDGPVAVTRMLGDTVVRRVIPPGGLFIMPGATDFQVRLEGELETLHLYLRRGMLNDVASSLGLQDPRAAQILPQIGEQDPLIESLVLGVREALMAGGPNQASYIDHLAQALAARLLKKFSAAASHGPETVRGSLTKRQLDRATDYIISRLGEPVTLPEIASACGLSTAYFGRAFKASTGVPPHQHLTRLRVDAAKRMLRNSRAPIAEIADECGFANQEHMTRVFRRALGITPANYRRFAKT